MVKGGGVILPPRPIFYMLLRNRLEFLETLWRLFLEMAWLQNGAKFLLLPPSGTEIWRPKPGSRPGILEIFFI
jgi:hypothetical protein